MIMSGEFPSVLTCSGTALAVNSITESRVHKRAQMLDVAVRDDLSRRISGQADGQTDVNMHGGACKKTQNSRNLSIIVDDY
uniref:Uncharacterized protein n=1 Tax=Ascaris lumbricoides TaxID=6252 RepID=A0A0M3IAZ2_ASCLU